MVRKILIQPVVKQKLKVIEELSKAGVRMGIMMGPMIPGLNEHEMQRIMKAAADNGATFTFKIPK